MPHAATNPLTPDQQRAVEHSGSPLIVLAGPGTGKTRTIIHRIAHMIASGTAPESIVAMTFTVKAATQLRERLAGILDPIAAERVNISTIHGFGNRLIRRFADVLELPPNVELIDAAQSHRLITEVILKHGLFAESRGVGLISLVEEMTGAFGHLANHGISSADAARFAAEWDKNLARNPADAAHHKRFADTAAALGHYEQARWSRGWLSYDDYMTLPLKLLREHRRALDICRQEYRAFVVDEFQDCNQAQIELLKLLCGHDSNANICVVGDDDQAIYRFRGADEQAFERFSSIWRHPTVIELTENYRSQPGLIACSNAIITKAGSRFSADKTIAFPASKTPLAPGLSTIEAIRLEEDKQDGEVVSAMILADRAATALEGKPRAWSSYAVIARNHAELERVGAALRVEGIPFDRAREPSLLDDEGVADVLAWVEWITDPAATWAARRILIRPPFGVPSDSVTAWERAFEAQSSQAAAGREGVEPPGRYDRWLSERAASEPSALACLTMYQRLAAETASLRADEALFHIITATDVAHADLLPGRERAQRVAALVSFLGFARDKQRRIAQPGNLRELWAYLRELITIEKGLKPARSIDEIDPVEFETSGADAAEGRVQLTTAHAAKGLEFDTVFLPKVKYPGYPNTRADDGWEPPPGLFDELDERPVADRRADEERRLFYVACTRAERRLVLLSKPNKTKTSTTNYFDELTGAGLGIVVRNAADVLKAAGMLEGAATRRLESAGLEFRGREKAREGGERARRAARISAANALDTANRHGVTADELREAGQQMLLAAEQLAVIAAAEKGTPPGWLTEKRSDLRTLADHIRSLTTKNAAADARGGEVLIRPMTAPLSLSFTAIDNFYKCPRCFYLHHVLGLPESWRERASIGSVVHIVLERFYKLWATADSEGLFKPGLEQLQAMARRALIESYGPEQPVDAAALEQLAAQMRLLWTRLHDPNAHIVEFERNIDFDYVLDGIPHRITAKIDRIDLLPNNTVRVIDYKTGAAKTQYTEPKDDDLQMGIYALAIRHGKGLTWSEGGKVWGEAEYWCLATGEKGSITLSKLNESKVRAQIDEAARAMLKGEFEPKHDCKGPCRLFRS